MEFRSDGEGGAEFKWATGVTNENTKLRKVNGP